jgi:polyisoprenoid-binding protein YceI
MLPDEGEGLMFRRHLKRWLIGGVAAVVVLAVGGPFAFIHFFDGTTAPKLALPAQSTSTGGTTRSTAATAASGRTASDTTSTVSGVWRVASGSQAGYRVKEVLLGQSTTAVGRTSKVSGQFDLVGTKVSAASFTVQMASVVSDKSQRNAQFDGRIMDVARYPTSTFRLTKPVVLNAIPAVGKTVEVSATGDLSMHGETRALTIELSAERVPSGIDVLGDASILFSEWNIANPSVGGFVTTANHGTLEVLLHLTKS